MPSPNPQPRPTAGGAVTPGKPIPVPTPRQPGRVNASTIKPRVVHQKPVEPEKRPGSFRLLIGFILVLVGAWFMAVEPYQVANSIQMVAPRGLDLVESGWNAATAKEPSEKSFDATRNFLDETETRFLISWAPLILGALILILGGLCLKRRFGIFLISLLLLMLTSLALFEAMGLTPVLSWILIGAAALAYLIQSGQKRSTTPAMGVLGFLFVFLALMATVRHWFNWPQLLAWGATQLGWVGNATGFFATWGELVTWGLLLTLATLGAIYLKGRLLNVLGAALVAMLIVILFQNARFELIHFPELGPNVKPLPSNALANIEPWQWLAIFELVVITGVLIYRGAGAGGLAIVFASLWLLAGFQVDKSANRLAFTRQYSNKIARDLDHMSSPDSANPRSRYSRPATAAMLEKERLESQAAQIAMVSSMVWVYLNAIFAGIIAICGLRLMVKDASIRWWIGNALWLVFALVLMWVYMNWPQSFFDAHPEVYGAPKSGFDIGRFLSVIGVHPIHNVIVGLVAVFAAAFFGLWALRWNSRYDTWLYVAATIVFLGTLSSFVTLAVLIRFGGFDPLPIQSYVALAVAQSSLMWILLMHVNFRDRDPVPQPPAKSAPIQPTPSPA